MVSYADVQASNSKIETELPPGLVAIFIGGTNGIGEYTLRQFAQHAKQPRVYFIGRSQEAGDRIANDCTKTNPDGTFTFIKADASLLKNVDHLCQQIKSKERQINLLVLSIGTLDFVSKTSEGLPVALALVHYARARFIQNLLPELQAATGLRRVVSIFAGTKEGPLAVDDLHATKVPLMKGRGHAASLVTAGMETLSKRAPNVSFIHTFPGPVKSGIGRDMPGIVGGIVRGLAVVLGPFFNIPNVESGAYHLYFATSGHYPAAKTSTPIDGVALGEGASLARGTDGNNGSGMYCIDQRGESANASVEELLGTLKKNGSIDKVWEDLESEWSRILKSTSELDVPAT